MRNSHSKTAPGAMAYHTLIQRTLERLETRSGEHSSLPPGDHTWTSGTTTTLAALDTWREFLGQRRSSESPRGLSLENQRRLRWLYGGMSTGDLRRLAREAATMQGSWAHNLVTRLEQRLDTTLWRAHWCTSPGVARHMIRGGYVTVNGVLCVYPSHRLHPGDVVRLTPQGREGVWTRLEAMWKSGESEQDSRAPGLSRDRNSGISTTPAQVLGVALSRGALSTLWPQKSGALGVSGQALLSQAPGDIGVRHLAQCVVARLYGEAPTGEAMWHLLYGEGDQAPSRVASPHLEVEYGTMSLVYLYGPQCVPLYAPLDIASLERDLL